MTTELQAPIPAPTPGPSAAPVSSNGNLKLVEGEASVREVVREHVANSPDFDPVDVADALLDDLTPGQLREAAHIGIGEIVRDQARANRNRKRAVTSSPASSRWDEVAQAEQEHKDVLLHRVCLLKGNQHVKPVYKFLGDCTSADMAAAESIKREQAAGALASVKAYKRLREELKSPKQQVRSLGADRVREILYA